MNEEDKLIKEQFDKLPKEMQLAINAVPWKSLVKEIATSNNLDSEQTESLETETMLIIYGFINPSEYINNLVDGVQIEEVVATAMAEEVENKIIEAISQKVDEIGKEKSIGANTSVPELAPDNLPMIEEGEKVHEVPHVEQNQNKAPLPDYRYNEGKDPYREPL